MNGPEDNGGSAGLSLKKALVSWKEIAAYMDCGVTTVQRWEQEAGLPIRRRLTGKRATPYAYPSELDAWLEQHNVTNGGERAARRAARFDTRHRPYRGSGCFSRWQVACLRFR